MHNRIHTVLWAPVQPKDRLTTYGRLLLAGNAAVVSGLAVEGGFDLIEHRYLAAVSKVVFMGLSAVSDTNALTSQDFRESPDTRLPATPPISEPVLGTRLEQREWIITHPPHAQHVQSELFTQPAK